jgi:hypothetical protein
MFGDCRAADEGYFRGDTMPDDAQDKPPRVQPQEAPQS